MNTEEGTMIKMTDLFLVRDDDGLRRLRAFAGDVAPMLNEYLKYLEKNYMVTEPPRSIVWTDFESAAFCVSDNPLPAYTNDYRIVIAPDIEVWKNLYLKQLDDYADSEPVERVRTYYGGLGGHNILQLLGHELAHHSELFIDEAYDDGEMWFEEGMAEYISRKYFLTEEEYAAEKETNLILVSLFDEKFGRPPLNAFSQSTCRQDITHIFYSYWRSFLAVDSLVERSGGDVRGVFDLFCRMFNETADFDPEKLFGA